MELNDFARLLYHICMVGTEILLFSIPVGIGISLVVQAKFSKRTRIKKNKRNFYQKLLIFLSAPITNLSGVRDRIYFKKFDSTTPEFDFVQVPDTTKSVIVWIHGTWKKPAISAHTNLLARLTEEFPNAMIITFNWHSRNQQLDRNVASELLQRELAKSRYSDIPISLIGHSHGGSVAAMVASSLSESRDIKVITLATPFVSMDFAKQEMKDRRRVTQSTLSAIMTPFQLWSVCAGLGAGMFLWLSGVHLLPPIDGLFRQEASDIFVAVIFGALIAVRVGSFRLDALEKRIKAVRTLEEMKGVNTKAVQLTALRADNDPLLDTMTSVVDSYDDQIARDAFIQKKRDILSSSMVSDFILKLAAVVMLIYINFLVFPALARASLNLTSEIWIRITLVAYVAIFLALVAIALWRWPIRLLVLFGMYIMSVLSTFFTPYPRDILLTMAQANAAGLPTNALLAGAIRIKDAPSGQTAITIETNGKLKKVCILKRHTEMLRLPEVIDKVIEVLQSHNSLH